MQLMILWAPKSEILLSTKVLVLVIIVIRLVESIEHSQ